MVAVDPALIFSAVAAALSEEQRDLWGIWLQVPQIRGSLSGQAMELPRKNSRVEEKELL